jgi:ubiquitin C-terminal hydrolase
MMTPTKSPPKRSKAGGTEVGPGEEAEDSQALKTESDDLGSRKKLLKTLRLRSSEEYEYADHSAISDLMESNGRSGLHNLGNTCFLNAALQCLSHTVPLTQHFLSGLYKKELNKSNPDGAGGALAKAYANLLQKMWVKPKKKKTAGETPAKAIVVNPKAFKKMLGKFASQFEGYEQEDAQEFLSFLMDGLHEDLNRVMTKPYVEIKDSLGRPDETVAAESWYGYLQRNKSIVVDLFQGQLKSTLTCAVCRYTNVTFDPFMYMSLPVGGSEGYNKDIESCLSQFTQLVNLREHTLFKHTL